MRLVCVVIAMGMVALTTSRAIGQTIAESLLIQAASAATWADRESNVIQLTGPVTIDLDRTRLTAQQAVIWLRPVGGTILNQQQAEIVLLGDASVKQLDAVRTGGKLFVTATVRGPIRVTAATRSGEELTQTPLFKEAAAIRHANHRPAVQVEAMNPALPARMQTALPVTPTPPGAPTIPPPPIDVRFQADEIATTRTSDGHIAVTMGGNLLLLVKRRGELIEMRAERIVLITKLQKPEEARDLLPGQTVRDKIDAVYLEDDVRLDYTPAEGSATPEQRMRAQRAYYELATDRAILTDAVFQTIDPKTQIPMVMRADTLRQLATNQFQGDDIRITTSTFANPSFAVAADKAYVRIEPTNNPRLGNRFTFSASHVKPEFFGLPVFWFPVAGGSVTEHGFPLRNIQVGSSNKFGFGLETEWGLLETLGIPPSRDLDISYRADYFSDRGPAGGIDADYRGGFITETTRQPWNFQGDVRSYFVLDHGVDDLGASRADVAPAENLRGRVLWRHQQFLPENWQVQLRAGYVSDATFLEQWFLKEWEDGEPEDLSFYAKRQRDSEALTILFNYQPNRVVTDAEFVQEQFEVGRLPELGYHRIGDSFADDSLTFFSNNTFSVLRFNDSNRTLIEQGFGPGVSPGLPSVGQTGTTDDAIYRGDFRQQIDYPINAGKFKVVPYLMGRATGYSDSPAEDEEHRLYVGAGLRMSTSFWRTIDSAHNRLLDVNRLRHVVEPELNLFTSAQTTDRNNLYIFDEEVDDIKDISAVSIALRQRWQTKRGGPGRWRSVDFFTFNIEGNFFDNEPPDAEYPPNSFRGLFFPSLPEASIPRDAINADATWRISDDTVLMSDVQYNLEEKTVATAAIGLAVRRDERLSYTIGNSYIDALDSNITSVGLNYMISRKYTFGYNQSFDFGQGDNVSYTTTLTRKFDTFALIFRANYDQYNDESSFGFSLQPMGAGGAFGTDNAFGGR